MGIEARRDVIPDRIESYDVTCAIPARRHGYALIENGFVGSHTPDFRVSGATGPGCHIGGFKPAFVGGMHRGPPVLAFQIPGLPAEHVGERRVGAFKAFVDSQAGEAKLGCIEGLR